ncbi:MAG: enoyl-CoA hydratase/isomerase family protein [Clostridiales Family XIII bacterium]|jgi:enoyl-CoA hydratase|nr:enoyl-CoA hydratase/isomerase family protein [Clostridiales Family XIII bacterium]
MSDYREYETLLTEKKDGYIIVKTNRPEALNALNADMLRDIADVFTAIARDDEVNAVILTGEGRAFVAGADIAQMSRLSAVEGRAFMKKGQAAFQLIEDLEKPVIAAVNGFALGGGLELAMACDIRFASDKAKFGQPEVGLGIIPGFGGTQRLARLVGKGMAKYLIYSGGTIGAEEALSIGLVEKVYPADELIDRAVAFVDKVLKNAPLAIRMAKVAINTGSEADLRTAVAFEAEAMSTAFGSEDRVEGMTAFLEKRPPDFKCR